jgi:hypothetical protein
VIISKWIRKYEKLLTSNFYCFYWSNWIYSYTEICFRVIFSYFHIYKKLSWFISNSEQYFTAFDPLNDPNSRLDLNWRRRPSMTDFSLIFCRISVSYNRSFEFHEELFGRLEFFLIIFTVCVRYVFLNLQVLLFNRYFLIFFFKPISGWTAFYYIFIK